jgi:thioredoxin reductase
LGFAGRGEALRRRGGGACRRGQFGGTGRGVSRTEGKTFASRGTWARFRSLDVAISHRPHRRAAQCRAAHWDRDSRLEGNEVTGLTAAVFRERATGATHMCPLRHLFMFIGADPNTDWINHCVALDNKGFVMTGDNSTGGASDNHRPVLPLETSRPGVFAIGDVRAGSTKRVSAAVGEGAAVVPQIHSVLAAE